MTNKPTLGGQVAISNEELPTAKVRDKSASLLRASKMWWITLLCLIMASWLTYRSLPENGPMITISFPQGHGLKPGDAVRFRGIEVGQVTNVSLNADLSGVDVQVMLKPGGGQLDREGTRFWIVRPRLSLTEIQGLETAVGAKYIAVSPGDLRGPGTGTFEGLAVAPADELNRGGLQVVLRSDDRHGISTGASVTWRGVKTGRVLSVNLSPDARHVHTTILIDRKYRRLIRGSSKFWVNSGFGVDVGLGGVKLSANSLSSILNGGVSFVTTAETKTGDTIRNGHVFRLTESPDPSWLKTDAAVPLIDVALPETVMVSGEFQTSTLGISRTKSFSQQGILAKVGKGTVLLTAGFPTAAVESESLSLTMIPPGKAAVDVSVGSIEESLLTNAFVSLPATGPASVQVSDIQSLKMPEDCLLFRSAVIDGRSTPMMQTIDLEQLVSRAGRWIIQDDEVDFSEWHGAPVLGMSAGQIVGILAIIDGQAQIVASDSQ